MRPPSHAFQFQLIVTTIAAASNTTNAGTTNLCHFGFCFGSSGTCGSAFLTGAGALAAAIVVTPSLKASRCAYPLDRGRSSDDSRSAESEQSDHGIGNTLVLGLVLARSEGLIGL